MSAARVADGERPDVQATSAASREFLSLTTKGAIGIDWFSGNVGGVSWLISLPRKKLITQ